MAFSFVPSKENIFDVGAFEAKTYFSELLRKVQEGAIVHISKNGKQVAVLQGKKSVRNEEALAAHNRIIARNRRFESLRTSLLTAKNLSELKNEGRKY